LVVFAAAGLLVALSFSGAASAFPRNCSGVHCSGSASDDFGTVCAAGASTYWEDSYLPANAVDPRLTHFTVTPKPPCSGAEVSGVTVDPWPAERTDPDGKNAHPKAGEATFRVRWTVTVPPNSHPLGSMKVDWGIAWTEPAGSTATTGTGSQPAAPFDLAAHVKDITHGETIDWVDWESRNGGRAGSPLFNTGGWYEGNAKVTVSNVSPHRASPPFAHPNPDQALAIVPDLHARISGAVELTGLEQVHDSAVTGGPRCHQFSARSGRPASPTDKFNAPDELVCTIRPLAPLTETGALNVSFVTSNGIGDFQASARGLDCLHKRDEGQSGCQNNTADQSYNFNPPRTELREPEIGAGGALLTWILASGQYRNARSAAGATAAATATAQFAVLTLGDGAQPTCTWLADQSGRFVVKQPQQRLFTLRPTGTLCVSPVWLDGTAVADPTSLNTDAPAGASVWTFTPSQKLPKAGYVLLVRVLLPAGSAEGLPKALGVSADQCVADGLCNP
jgi:hypothetical protein